MCCNVDNCCCCLDHRRGVQFMGVLLSVLFVIAIIATVIRLEQQRGFIADCSEKEAASLGADTANTQHGDSLKCFDKTVLGKDIKKYYPAIVAVAVFVVCCCVLGLLANVLLVLGTVKYKRWLLLPWLILYMIFIVLMGIGLILTLIAIFLASVGFSFLTEVLWIFLLYMLGKFLLETVTIKVDCSGKRLMVCWKI
jgi:hypothetical protein